VTGFVLGAAFCAIYLMLEGMPPLAPVSSKQKLAYLVLLAVVLGAGLLPMVKDPRLRGAIAAAFLLLSLVWLGWRKITSQPTAELVLLLLAFWLAGTAILAGTSQRAGRKSSPGGGAAGLHAPILLLVASLASSLVAILGAYIGFSQLSGALGALLGGYLLVEYLAFAFTAKTPGGYGAESAFALGGAWLAGLAVALLFARDVSLPAVLLVGLIFVVGPLTAKLVQQIVNTPGMTRRALAPIIYGAIVAVPGAAGVVVAWMASTS
jgi:hypothetical protein